MDLGIKIQIDEKIKTRYSFPNDSGPKKKLIDHLST